MNLRAYERNRTRLWKLAAAVEAALGINMHEAGGGSWYGLYDPGSEGRCPIKVRVADHANQTTNGMRNESQVQFVAAVGQKIPSRKTIRVAVAGTIKKMGRSNA